MAQIRKRKRQTPVEGTPKRSPGGNTTDEGDVAKMPASKVLALHLSNMQLIKLEAEWTLGNSDNRIDGIELHRRVLCERRVSEQEILDAVKNADASDPKTRCVLTEIAKESTFPSVREAAEKASRNAAWQLLDSYSRYLVLIECYGRDPGQAPCSETEVLAAIEASDKHNGYVRRMLSEIASYCESGRVRHAAKKARDENPIQSVIEAINSGLSKQELMETIEGLVEKGADINEKEENGNTALHLAASKNFPELVRYLAGKTRDIDVRNDGGYTPLMCACSYGMVENAKILVSKGADVNARNIFDKTVLAVTDVYYDKHSEIVRFLKERGAQMQ